MHYDLKIHSTFKRSKALNQMIYEQLDKLYRIHQQISYTRIYLKEGKQDTEKDKVIIQMGLSDRQVVITEQGIYWKNTVKSAFNILKGTLQK